MSTCLLRELDQVVFLVFQLVTASAEAQESHISLINPHLNKQQSGVGHFISSMLNSVPAIYQNSSSAVQLPFKLLQGTSSTQHSSAYWSVSALRNWRQVSALQIWRPVSALHNRRPVSALSLRIYLYVIA